MGRSGSIASAAAVTCPRFVTCAAVGCQVARGGRAGGALVAIIIKSPVVVSPLSLLPRSAIPARGCVSRGGHLARPRPNPVAQWGMQEARW